MGNYLDRSLIEYLPTVLKETREFQAIMQGEQPEIYNIFKEIQIALDNQFILTLTEYGVKRWEKMLSISPKATQTLEERRFAILIRLAEQRPYVIRMLEIMLTNLCGQNGFVLVLNANEYYLEVKVTVYGKNSFNEVGLMLRRICPANLVLFVSLLYNTWGVIKDFTWGYLKAKKWREIKEEVL